MSSSKMAKKRESPFKIFRFLHSKWQYAVINPEGICDDKRDEKALSSGYMDFPFEYKSCQGWAGNFPCVFGPTEGCSCHNPHKLLIAYNKCVPSDKKPLGFVLRLTGSPKQNVVGYDKAPDGERIWSLLHLDHSTADPLDPIHPSIRYALAYYHIHWVQTAASLETQRARTKALACHGTVAGDGKKRPEFRYWTQPYWYKDSFYIQQAIRFTIEPKKRKFLFGHEYAILGYSPKDWTFRTCPHYRQRFQQYEFRETRGLIKAGMSYVSKWRDPLGGSVRKWTKWHSVYGPGYHILNCQFCCTDTCVDIDLVKDKIVVHIWIWKDLGKALSPFDPKWISALRPEASVWSRSRTEAVGNKVRAAVRAAMREESG